MSFWIWETPNLVRSRKSGKSSLKCTFLTATQGSKRISWSFSSSKAASCRRLNNFWWSCLPGLTRLLMNLKDKCKLTRHHQRPSYLTRGSCRLSRSLSTRPKFKLRPRSKSKLYWNRKRSKRIKKMKSWCHNWSHWKTMTNSLMVSKSWSKERSWTSSRRRKCRRSKTPQDNKRKIRSRVKEALSLNLLPWRSQFQISSIRVTTTPTWVLWELLPHWWLLEESSRTGLIQRNEHVLQKSI